MNYRSGGYEDDEDYGTYLYVIFRHLYHVGLTFFVATTLAQVTFEFLLHCAEAYYRLEGGREDRSKVQTADQEWDKGNAQLQVSASSAPGPRVDLVLVIILEQETFARYPRLKTPIEVRTAGGVCQAFVLSS